MKTLQNTANPVLSDVLFSDNPMLSREKVTVLAGAGSVRKLLLGTVIALVLHGAGTAAAPVAQGTNSAGNGVFSALSFPAGNEEGTYVLQFLDATHIEVVDPTGNPVGHAVAGVAYAGVGPNFTFTAGGTAQVAGDQFTIAATYADGSQKAVQWDPAGDDGSQEIYGVLITNTCAPDGEDADGVAEVRDAVLVGAGLIWPDGISDEDLAAGITALAAKKLILR